MDIQNNSIVTDADTEVLDSQITQISNDFAETYYFDSEQEEELELLVAKAMKLGELYERKKWQAAKVHEAEKLKGCVVVPLENVRFFSNDGENYEIHDNLVQAKDEAVRAIEYYSDRLADQQLDPRSDGNFQQISYGIVLAGSSYSVDHIVTQQDIDDGEYSYDVGTEIMSLFLVEAARGGNE